MPPLAVAILPPMPSMFNFFSNGTRIVKDSSPLIQVGTLTLSPLTLLRPSYFISLIIQSIAFSKFFEPLSLGPNISQR